MRVRRANAADASSMMYLEVQSTTAAHWSRQQYECLFSTAGDPGQPERLAWVVQNDTEEGSGGVPDQDPKLLAFLVAHKIDTEWELENVVVAESARRRGIASLLLRELIVQVRAARGRSIFLEVRDSNQSARALYRKMGFEEAGFRKNYYASPIEDAIVCRLRLD